MMNKKGQALVEFVLILPIVLFIILAMFDFGSIMYHKNHLENILSSAVEMYEDNYTEQDIIDKLSLNKEQITLKIEKQGSKDITIFLTKACDIITPGLNYVMNSPYEITTSRSIIYEP